MPKRKAAKSAATHISFRLKPAELEQLDADRKALPGVPVARNTYAKHAVTQYPKLRGLEDILRKFSENKDHSAHGWARSVLDAAGIP